jgi:hypothetical protein
MIRQLKINLQFANAVNVARFDVVTCCQTLVCGHDNKVFASDCHDGPVM